MSFSIDVPSANKITLSQFIEYKKCKDEIEKVMHVTGWGRSKVEQLKPLTIDTTIALYESELKRSTDFIRVFKSRIDFKSMRLAFIPDLEENKFIEWIEIDTQIGLMQKDHNAIAQLMAVLYRPITKTWGEKYLIQPYDKATVNDYLPHILKMPIGTVNASLAFFLHLNSELLQHSLTSLNEILSKSQTL